jgi:hypothetical protein
MSDPTALAGFVAKWRARWPEWSIAQVFVPAAQRDIVAAWFALLQELTDAAWSGSDPTPGLAKLAWWQEELRGWSKGARRHPLGDSLQRLPAPWGALGASLMALQQSRERADDAEAAIRITRPFAVAVAECEAALFGVPADASALLGGTLLAERLLADPQAAVPLRIPVNDDEPTGSATAWAAELQSAWPLAATRPRRLQAALLRARLSAFAVRGRNEPLSPWRTLIVAWRAARKA